MTYEWKEHTAEVELVVTGDSPEDVFQLAADAFGRYIELDPDGEAAMYRVTVNGHDHGTLLVALLEELIYLADTEGFVPDRVRAELVDGRLVTELTGRRTAVQPIVKAATYHDLAFEQEGDQWRAHVVIDV